MCCIFVFEVIEGGFDFDIVDYVFEYSDVVQVFLLMKCLDDNFCVFDFFQGV